MIHYRREKRYKDELKVIERGVKIFKEQLEKQHSRAFADKGNKKKLHDLSILIGKKVGLVDKKGKSNYLPEPIARWEKRRKTVENKIK